MFTEEEVKSLQILLQINSDEGVYAGYFEKFGDRIKIEDTLQSALKKVNKILGCRITDGSYLHTDGLKTVALEKDEQR